MAIKVLSVTSEAVPLVKTGGLADVAGALPKALAAFDVDMRVLLPAYRPIRAKINDAKPVWTDHNLFGGPASAFALVDTPFYLLDAPHLFDREGGPYSDSHGDYGDNAFRFAALSFAAALIAEAGFADGWVPDIMHGHDWQAGFAPTYIKARGRASTKSVMTIHNIAFQGWAPASELPHLMLPAERFSPDGLEYYGALSALKAGLIDADWITTVSPNYADELKTGQFGMGLEGVIRGRAHQMSGILNGVDYEIWSPEKGDGFTPYSRTKLAGKAKNRTALAAEFGIAEPEAPLAIVVSRLSDQKGMDLLIDALPAYFAAGGALCLLGSGDAGLERALGEIANRFPDRFGLRIGYDEGLAHRMFAGADTVLVPSRFEPGGLTQLYGLAFGTLPIVAATGGLADTVVHANIAALQNNVATGLSFARIDAEALQSVLLRSIALYRDKKTWQKMMKNAMGADFGWARAAASYAEIYRMLHKK